jgi:N4-gp56 family major capsid protein
MATNFASTFSADVVAFIQDELLDLTQKELVAYQFATKLTLPKGRGTTYYATRFNRLSLPFAPLSEGVPPAGETMSISQVSAVAQQWGDTVTITDIAEGTIFHPVLKEAVNLLGIQAKELLERNTMNALLAGTQVNYINSRGSRTALQSGDVLDTTTVIRTNAAMITLGARRFLGSEMSDIMVDAEMGGKDASSNPRSQPHFTAIIHPLVAADFGQNSTVINAWSYSDVNRLYNFEAGEWRGIRFCESNMVPSWTGVANTGLNATAGTAGNLAGAPTNYYVIVTASDTLLQYESRIYAISSAVSVTGPNGSISVTLPNLAGYTFNAYIGTTTSPANLAVSASGPQGGPLSGQATQMAGNQTVILTAVGTAQTPPAFPGNANGLTVYPTFVIGKGAYGQVILDDISTTYLDQADKLDKLNQLRVAGYKLMYGTILLQNIYLARIESVSGFTSTFG